MKNEYLDFDLNIDTKSVDDKTGEFEGYGSVFGGKPDSYGDIIMPGAFSKTLKAGGRNGNGIALLWQHDQRNPIGVWTEIVEDKRGLKMKGKLTLGVRQADEALLLMRDGAIKGLSIGFNLAKNGSTYDSDTGVRYLKEIILWEVSLVTFPASVRSQVTKVKAIEEAQSVEELALALKAAGFSKEFSAQFVSQSKDRFGGEEAPASKSSLSGLLGALKAENTRMAISKSLG